MAASLTPTATDARATRELARAASFEPLGAGARLQGLRVLLIYPPVRLSSPPLYPPFGLISIGAVLEAAGAEVEILDLNLLRLDFESLQGEIRRRTFDIVGIGGMTTVYYYMKLVSRWLEQEYPGVSIIGGGSACSASPRIVMERTGIDVACIGEAEPVIVDLCAALWRGGDLSEIPGIWYRDAEGQVRTTQARPRMANIGDLPFPAYHLIDMEAYIRNTYLHKYRLNDVARQRVEELGIDPEMARRPVVLFTKRGCPFACDFCYRNFGRKVVQTSIEHTLAHMDLLAERYRTAFFVFGDEIFNIDRGWVLEFCQRIIAEDRRYVLATTNALRANLIDRELLETMKRAGFCSVGIGIESFHDPTLKAMRKSQKSAQIHEALRLTRELGIHLTSAQLLFGYETDGPESMQANLEALDTLDLTGGFAIPCPYPGTELYDKAVARGLIPDEEDWLMQLADKDISDRVINLSGMPDAELHRLVQYGRDQVLLRALRRRHPVLGRMFAPLFRGARAALGVDLYQWIHRVVVFVRTALVQGRFTRPGERRRDEAVRDEALALLRALPARRPQSAPTPSVTSG